MNAKFPAKVHHDRDSPFDDLPTEIKVMILCHMPQISSPSSTVHASPKYYQAYLGARSEILHNITIRTLQKNDIDLLDPWTAVHPPQLRDTYRGPLRAVIIEEWLKSYAQGRMDGFERRLAPQDSLAILSLQRKFTVVIAKYCNCVLAINPLTGIADNDPLLPSQLEQHRLYRGLWRYEVYSKLFAPGKEAALNHFGQSGHEPTEHPMSNGGIIDRFLKLFPIHEVEELACLQEYAGDCYQHLSSEGDQLVSSRPKLLPGCDRDNYQQMSLVSLGPRLLHEILTAESKDECKSRIAEVAKKGTVRFTMRVIWDIYGLYLSLQGWRWKGMHDEFASKRVPTTGWLWASSRGIGNTDFRLRRWGYVFWDQERLDVWGIVEENMLNWPELRRTFPRTVSATGVVDWL